MKKLIINTTVGLILYGLVLYFSIGGFFDIFKTYGVKPFEFIAQKTEAKNSENVLSASSFESKFVSEIIESDINTSVYSEIKIEMLGSDYYLNSADIENLFGNETKMELANEYFNENGIKKLQNILRKLLNTDSFDKKYFQTNKNGIKRDEITGFEYYEHDYGPDVLSLSSKIHEILLARLKENSGKVENVKVDLLKHYGTNGEYSTVKYIEFDNSSQKIYA